MIGPASVAFRLTLACLASIFLAACMRESDANVGTPAIAWSEAIEFAPAFDSISDISVTFIDAGWKRAALITHESLASRAGERVIREFADSTLSFALDRDLNGDGFVEQFAVGTYEATNGEVGRFVLVMQGGALLAHFTEAGRAGFGALLPESDGVRWYKCLACGEYELIRWSGGAFVLE